MQACQPHDSFNAIEDSRPLRLPQGSWKVPTKYAPTSRFMDQMNWGTAGDPNYEPLTFFDTGLMGDWMRAQGENKTTFYNEESSWHDTEVWRQI